MEDLKETDQFKGKGPKDAMSWKALGAAESVQRGPGPAGSILCILSWPEKDFPLFGEETVRRGAKKSTSKVLMMILMNTAIIQRMFLITYVICFFGPLAFNKGTFTSCLISGSCCDKGTLMSNHLLKWWCGPKVMGPFSLFSPFLKLEHGT